MTTTNSDGTGRGIGSPAVVAALPEWLEPDDSDPPGMEAAKRGIRDMHQRIAHIPHAHRDRVDGCFRCDLSGDES